MQACGTWMKGCIFLISSLVNSWGSPPSVEVCQHSVPERWGPKKVWSKYLELYLYKMRSVKMKMNRVPSPVLQEQLQQSHSGNLYLFLLWKERKIEKKHCRSNTRNQSFSTRLLCVLFSSSSATFPTVHCWDFLFFIFATHAHTSVAHVWSTERFSEPNVLLNGQSGQSIPLRVRFGLWWIASKCNGVIKTRNLLIWIALKWTVSSPKIPYGGGPWRYGP